MSSAFPKPEDRQAFEKWAEGKAWFVKTKGSFRRNSNDTAYTHYRVNDRWLAFCAGVSYATQEAQP